MRTTTASWRRVAAATCAGVLALSVGLSSTVAGEAHAAPARPYSVNPAKNLPTRYDIQAHRGGRGEFPESTKAAFAHAIDLHVTTLEMDITVSRDGALMVWHDITLQADKCRDTRPATLGDPMFPYVGKMVSMLTYNQLKTVRCDRRLKDFPEQLPAPDSRILTLDQVFQLANAKRANSVFFNIETKVLPVFQSDADVIYIVKGILASTRKAGVYQRIMVQSFDWRSLAAVRKMAPSVPTSMLFSPSTWFPLTPMSGPVDYNEVGGDIIKAAKQLGVQILSPSYGKDDNLFANVAFCATAHRAGLWVVPWTVNLSDVIVEQIRSGADGLISDYPTRAMAAAHKMKKL